MIDLEQFRQIVQSELADVNDAEMIRRTVQVAGSALDVPPEAVQQIAEEMIQAAGVSTEPEVPRLQIDWGLEFRVGVDLTPKFHLICPGFSSQPHVVLLPDNRFDCANWTASPNPERLDESHWTFTESLRLTNEGHYRLKLRVVFRDRAAEPFCYNAEVNIAVVEQAEPELHIKADDAAVIDMPGQNLRSLGRRVFLDVKGQGLVRISGHSAGDQPPDDSQSSPLSVELPLQPDWELKQRMPRLSSGQSRKTGDAATLVLPDGRRILLLARRRVSFGRNQEQDVVLRLEPLDDNRKKLSQHISRTHFWLESSRDGLLVDDKSAHGTFVASKHLHRDSTLIPHDARSRSHVISVGGILDLELTCHSDPTWNHMPECLALFESQYRYVLGGAFSRVWEYARESNLDAVRLRRRRHLPVRHYLSHITQNLPAESVQTLNTIVGTMPLVDELADKEQYVLLYRTATLGGSGADAIHLSGAGLASCHARILHFGDCFWLEHLDERNSTTVDGKPLAAHELVPLSPGVKLKLGDLDVVFDEYSRLKL